MKLNPAVDQVATPAEILKQSQGAHAQDTQETGPEPVTLLKHDSSMKRTKPTPLKSLGTAFAIVLAGTVTGFGLSRAYQPSQSGSSPATSDSASSASLQAGDIIGSQDDSTFSDPAEGVVVKGGLEGEGSHHLIREGGPARNVYLTSSVVDLDQLTNHRVKIWGETFAAQRAGWLMDVGRVEVVELNAPKPFEEAAAAPDDTE